MPEIEEQENGEEYFYWTRQELTEKFGKLKNCPFCRNAKNLVLEANGYSAQVLCYECGAAGPKAKHVKDAVCYWNNRPVLF